MTGRIHWRCFHCGDTFTLAQERWAREHFGRNEDAEPVCLIRTAGESALLHALREAEDELAVWRSESAPLLVAMHSMAADHNRALVREEERGYNKGVQDARREFACEGAADMIASSYPPQRIERPRSDHARIPENPVSITQREAGE